MKHRLFVVFAVISACGIALGLVRLPSFFTPPPTPTERIIKVASGSTTTSVVRLEEDDPGWDCRSMGNRRCGP